jgi:parallel beta-helix repeat protein
MRKRWIVAVTTIAVAIAAGTVALQAQGGPTPTTISCGMVVTTNIVAANNLNCTGDGLIVGASGITINLNGHTIDGDDGPDLGIQTAGFDNVKIMNGRITDFDNGVSIDPGSNQAQLTGLEIRSSFAGVVATDSNTLTISGNRILSNNNLGILISTSNDSTIQDNRVVGTTADAILLSGVTASDVIGNIVTLNGHNGIQLLGPSTGNTVTQNVIARSGNFGIVLEGDSVDGNTISVNRSIGSVEAGIGLSDGDNNVLEGNVLSHNGAFGVRVADAANNNLVKRNQVAGNGDDGIYNEFGSDSNVYDQNSLIGNAGDGLDTDAGGSTTMIKKNTAYGNGEHGIEAATATDGGGNKASGNLDATQCQVVACS